MLANNVEESSTTTGLIDFILDGSSEFGNTFSSFYMINEKFRYSIDDGAGNREKGFGYLSSSNVLVREYVTSSTNSDSKVNFGLGTKSVFVDRAAEDYPFPERVAAFGAAIDDIIYPKWANVFANVSPVANRMNLIPFENACPSKFTEWAVYIRTAAAEVARFGIYNTDPSTGRPAAGELPIFESDDIDLSSTGVATRAFSDNVINAISERRMGRSFWLAMAFSGSSSAVVGVNYTSVSRTWTPTNSALQMPSYWQSFTMGTPTPGSPALPAISTMNANSNNFPVGGVR